MKKALFGLLIALMLGLSIPASASASVSVGVSVGGFYDELAPYGRWVTVSRWGECWAPSRVDVGWQPYSNGEWLFTDYGWTWVSYDPWGGDPYHYGSWVWDPDYGWVWVPGTVWAPAWVTWSYTDTYIGWAPLPPSFSLTYSGYVGAPIVEPARSYVFVPAAQLVGTSVATVRVAPAQNATILPAARSVTRLSVSGGVVRNTALAPTQVERLTGRRIAPVSLSRAKTRPVSLKASGIRGSRFAVTAPAAVRQAALGPRVRPGSARPEVRGHAQTSTRGPARAIAREHRRAPAPAPVVRESRGGAGRHTTRSSPVTRSDPTTHGRPPRGHASAPVSRPIERPRPSRPERLERPAPRHEAPPAAVRHEGPPAAREARPAPRYDAGPPQQAMAQPAPRAPERHEGPPPAAARAPERHQGPPPQAAQKGKARKEHGPPH